METIQNTPASERPRERCLERGAQSLSLRECLALIIGSGPPRVGCLGLANLILNRPGIGFSGIEEERAFFNAMEVSANAVIQDVPGLGLANQAKLLAAFELGRRYAIFRETKQTPRKLPRNSDLGSRALQKVLPAFRNESREWLGFIPFYRNSELGDLCVVEHGVRTHVNVDPAELFARLLSLRPVGFFLVHNHPSGNTTPSDQDFDLTRRVGALSRQLGIRLLGHWIVASRDERLIGMEFP
jgi:DNA repair protein RadC